MTHAHDLWIDVLARKLGLSVRATILLVFVASVVVFVSCYLFSGLPSAVGLEGMYDLVFYAPQVLVSLAAAVYVRNKMVALEAHAHSMARDPGAASESLAPLSRTVPVLVVSSGLSLAFVGPYILDPTPPASSVFSPIIQIPWFFLVWTMSTAIWVLGYSAVGVYRIGKLPMDLKPFTMDRSLGLKPFAATGLRLTGVYYGLVVLTVVGDLESPLPTTLMALRTLAFVTLGFVFFVLPLYSLHGQLVRAKGERIAWISRRYVRAMEEVEATDGPLGEGVERELLAVDKIQRDIQSIRTWPIDMTSLAKLLTIVLSVTAILLSRILASVFGI